MKKITAKKIMAALMLLADIAIIAGLVLTNVLSYYREKSLENQLAYLQDTTSIIQSEIGNMEANIEATLQEESSLIEDYSFALVGCDFANGTYDVAISIIPKEYTDSTMTSVFFGTHEYILNLDGYTYSGVATLPMSVSYDGNVTVLFTNGEKKSTEVLSGYEGIQSKLENALSATLDERNISYRDGKLFVYADVECDLVGEGLFEFSSLDLQVSAGNEIIYDYDLILESGGVIEPEPSEEDENQPEEAGDNMENQDADGSLLDLDNLQNPTGEENSLDTSQENEAEANTSNMTLNQASQDLDQELDAALEENAVSQGNGTTGITQTQENPQALDEDEENAEQSMESNLEDDNLELQASQELEEQENKEELYIGGISTTHALNFSRAVEGGKMIQIYITAKTKDGLTFNFRLFQAFTKAEGDGFVSSQTTYERKYDVYDDKGQKWNFM